MYTQSKNFGRFEGNRSRMIAKAAYNASLDGPDEEEVTQTIHMLRSEVKP